MVGSFRDWLGCCEATEISGCKYNLKLGTEGGYVIAVGLLAFYDRN